MHPLEAMIQDQGAENHRSGLGPQNRKRKMHRTNSCGSCGMNFFRVESSFGTHDHQNFPEAFLFFKNLRRARRFAFIGQKGLLKVDRFFQKIGKRNRIIKQRDERTPALPRRFLKNFLEPLALFRPLSFGQMNDASAAEKRLERENTDFTPLTQNLFPLLPF